jgi:hypothetical protein
MKRKPLAEWRAMRALLEGARPTVELVAQATARSARSLELAAEREGWRIDRMPEENIGEKLRGVIALLVERVEALGRKALEEGARIDKSEIDGLLSIIKGLDKVAEITRTEESAKQKQISRDEDLADVLTQINQRIIEFAQELAQEMAGTADRPVGS